MALVSNNKTETVLIKLEGYFDLVETWRERGLKWPRRCPNRSGSSSRKQWMDRLVPEPLRAGGQAVP